MTAHPEIPDLKKLDRLSDHAGRLGYEIVDLAGFLDLVQTQSKEQGEALTALTQSASQIAKATTSVTESAERLDVSVAETVGEVQSSAQLMRDMGGNARDLAQWVNDLNERTKAVQETLKAVKKNNGQIDSISMQVNTLAINAKIEAARAGEMGRGFAVVAEAINELSRQTQAAAEQISQNIVNLTDWVSSLASESKDFGEQARTILSDADTSDAALGRMEKSMQATHSDTTTILAQTKAADEAMQRLGPTVETLTSTVTETSTGIREAHARIESLIDTSEGIVQTSAAIGAASDDGPYIEFVRDAARRLSERLDEAMSQGKITREALFTRRYKPIAGTNPEQVMAPFTALFDEILPDIQEPALDFSDKVIFCAAVDQNGYLPTHNRKFSQPQSEDPVWNTANCRNRRIFDDRVGLKAGRNTEPFLLQVYRRDMGGGEFVMMKDLSAPIFVDKQHWGGLRFAYKF